MIRTNPRRRANPRPAAPSPIRLGVAVFMLAASIASTAAAAAPPMPPQTRFDQFIVRYRADAAPAHRANAIAQRLDRARNTSGVDAHVLRRTARGADVVRSERPMDSREAQAFMADLRSDPRIASVEVDVLMQPTMVPNDFSYPQQWNLFEAAGGINVPTAWDMSTGAGQVVAVIDTGITYHSDLAANILPGYDFISIASMGNDGDGRDADATDTGDAVNAGECGSGSPSKNSNWHGTAVAGTVAAVTNNAKGVAGVAFGAKVVPLRVIGKCGGYISDVSDAVIWASGLDVPGAPPNPHPASVINMSLAFWGSCSPSFQDAIDAAVGNGTAVVTGSANENVSASLMQPANCNHVITVGANARNGARTSYSNFGDAVDLSAPSGEGLNGILTTYNSGAKTVAAENYIKASGTSFSAPQVAAIAALMQSVAGGTLSPADIEALLRLTARPLPIACPEGCGAGILDAAAAVAAAAPTPPTLSINDASVNEGDSGSKLMTFTVSLSEASANAVTFRAVTSAGTALSSDYLHQDQVFTIAAGALSTTVSVPVLGDTTVEPTEYFHVDLDGPSGATIADAQGIGYLINNDGALLSINDIAVGEGNAGTKLMTFTVSLSQVAPGPVTYNFQTQAGGDATAGVDYIATTQNAQVIPQGQLAKTHTVVINGDTTLEPTEVLLAYVRQPQGASVWDGQGTGYLLNDDGPTLSIPDASVGEGASGSKLMNVTVQLSQASANDVVFGIATSSGSATAGNDYTALNLTNQVIPAGQTSKVFQIPVAGDTTIEQNETFLVTLAANPVGATLYDRQAIATIYNDDGPTLSVNDVSISEGNSGTKVATFTVSLSLAAGVPITYNIATSNVTATAGSDYVAKAVVGESISAGQLSRTFTVTLNGDTGVEANETFRVTLSNISAGATLFKFTGTGTITNDD